MTPTEIKSLRKRLGMSQAAFGRALGLDGANPDRSVRAWESGETDPTGPVRKLLALIDKDPSIIAP